MAYDKLTVKSSDRLGSGKATPLTGDAGNGIKVDNATQAIVVLYYNDSGNPVVLTQKNSPTIEAKVDEMTVADKNTVSIPDGEMVPLGPWDNTEYGNDDPDGGDIADGKAVLIDYDTGDGGKFFAIARGAL